MTNRLDTVFADLKAKGEKALITFTMGGDPDRTRCLDILHALAGHADIIEIGMPFTDPMADGPAIQAAGLRALSAGVNIKAIFENVQQFRSKNETTPLVLMGYFNPILSYGVEKFVNDCRDIGIDGLIVVDIPPEEADEIAPKAQQNGLCFIRLLTPTTDAARLPEILKSASGFLYYVSIAGVTGTASADPGIVGAQIDWIRKQTDLPVVAGFGIRTPGDAAAMGAVCDGVVVGSAFVQHIEKSGSSPALAGEIGEMAARLKDAMR